MSNGDWRINAVGFAHLGWPGNQWDLCVCGCSGCRAVGGFATRGCGPFRWVVLDHQRNPLLVACILLPRGKQWSQGIAANSWPLRFRSHEELTSILNDDRLGRNGGSGWRGEDGRILRGPQKAASVARRNVGVVVSGICGSIRWFVLSVLARVEEGIGLWGVAVAKQWANGSAFGDGFARGLGAVATHGVHRMGTAYGIVVLVEFINGGAEGLDHTEL